MERRINALETELKQKRSGAVAQAASASTSDAAPNATNPPATSAAKPTAKSTPPAAKATGDKSILGLTESPVPGLSIGAYGEVFFGMQQNSAAGGQWQNGFDARRFGGDAAGKRERRDKRREARDAPEPHGLVPFVPVPHPKLAVEKRITTGSIRTKISTGKTKRINGTVNLAGSE